MPDNTPTLRHANVNGLDLTTCDQGAGPVLLFVHGFPLDHSMWKPQLMEFSKDHRVIAPDLRGFGKNAAHSGTMTMEQFADDLAGLLDALGVDEPVIFCGLSMGGYIAWQFTRKYPDKLRALILCDTRAGAYTSKGAAGRYKLADSVLKNGTEVAATAMLPKLFAASTREQSPTVVDSVAEVIRSTAPETIAGALAGMAERPDVTPLLPTINLPTLVLVGEEDAITPAAEMREMAKAMPDATFHAIPQAGHMAPLENPQVVNGLIREFVGNVG